LNNCLYLSKKTASDSQRLYKIHVCCVVDIQLLAILTFNVSLHSHLISILRYMLIMICCFVIPISLSEPFAGKYDVLDLCIVYSIGYNEINFSCLNIFRYRSPPALNFAEI
jgi:hypothetical protein